MGRSAGTDNNPNEVSTQNSVNFANLGETVDDGQLLNTALSK